VRPLVPDVAYLSYAALPADAPGDVVDVPLGSPTVAIEVLSPGDRRADVDDKIATYLAAGTQAVIVVDPGEETVAVHDRETVRVLRAGDALVHGALPGFTLDVADLFARAKR